MLSILAASFLISHFLRLLQNYNLIFLLFTPARFWADRFRHCKMRVCAASLFGKNSTFGHFGSGRFPVGLSLPDIHKEKKQGNPLLTIILILLVLQVAFSGYQVYRSVTSDIQRARVTDSVAKYTASLDELTTQMLADFKGDVYNNPNVDSTAKQAVMTGEYNFNSTMLLIKQNNRLLELLTQIK